MIVLGSRSARRRDLLGSIVGQGQLMILPPVSPDEPGFLDLTSDDEIERQLHHVVQLKNDDVARQLITLRPNDESSPMIVVADTIVIAEVDQGARIVLGQPGPEFWEDDVRNWFRHFLSARTHQVWTGIRISRGSESTAFVIRSSVTFCEISDELLDWYVSTGESQGKAGGYAIQGFASAFVTQLQGSLTNVIGLPVMDVVRGLTSLGWSRSPHE